MSKPTDDLEAVRILVATLESFDPEARERIIRWSREKLGMSPETSSQVAPARPLGSSESTATTSAPPADIRTFINQKNPRSDNHLAAVVAYYHHFHAPAGERKDAITKEDLIDACRRADRKRPARAAQVLVNAYHAGLLDKADRAHYRLNSVGENLVAMVLPEGDQASAGNSRPRRATKKTIRKRPEKKESSRRKPARSTRS